MNKNSSNLNVKGSKIVFWTKKDADYQMAKRRNFGGLNDANKTRSR